jgi:hypothetical protein
MLLLQCFLHFHPTASTMACFLPFSDHHDLQCPKFPPTWGAGHYKPYASTTLLPSSLRRTNVFSCRLQNPHFSQYLDSDIAVFVITVPNYFESTEPNAVPQDWRRKEYVVHVIFKICTRGGQLDELQEPHFRRQLRQEPCINKIKPLCIWCLLISVHPTTIGYFQLVMSLLSLENFLKHLL